MRFKQLKARLIAEHNIKIYAPWQPLPDWGWRVIVEQIGRVDIGKIMINAEEWPAIRAAVDQMVALCGEIEAESPQPG